MALLLLVFLVPVILFALWLYLYQKAKRSVAHIPGSSQLFPPYFFEFLPKPIINILLSGSTWKAQNEIVTKVGPELLRKHGPIAKLVVGNTALIFVNNVDFKKQAIHLGGKVLSSKGPFKELLTEDLGNNVFSVSDEVVWKRHRTLLNPAFSDKSLGCVCDATVEAMHIYFEAVEKNSVRDIIQDMGQLTLDVIGKAGFGFEFDAVREAIQLEKPKDNTINAKTRYILSNFFSLSVVPKFLRNYLFPAYADAKDTMLHTIDDIIQARRKVHEDVSQDAPPRDLLERLMRASSSEDGEAPLTNKELVANCFIFLIAGHESSTRAIMFAVYFLAIHEQIQKKAQAFVDKVLGKRDPVYADIENLTYIENIIKESMRIYPTASAMVRTPTQDIPAEKGPLGKYAIPKDSILFFCNNVNMMDEQYFSNPTTFNPERWESSEADLVKKNGFIYTPFGFGNRSCIGKKFAMIEIITVVAMLLQHFSFEHVDKENYGPVELITNVTAQPRKPFIIKFKPRQ